MHLRVLAVLGAGLVSSVVLLAGVAIVGLTGVLGGSATAFGAGAAPSRGALSTVPHSDLVTFEAAAASCPGLPWNVLAGIGRAETDFGADTQTSSAGAVGPMQFLPATFAEYDRPVPVGGATPPSPYDPTDAIWAAARLLCANGAKDGSDLPGAIFAYDHSKTYVDEVLSFAASYVATAQVTGAPDAAAAIAVSFAIDQLGTPYLWGGETPGVGFDCSGLTQAAYAAAGVHIPRTSTAQWTTLPHVPLADLEPGDLVFFEPGEFSPGLPGHVGIYLGDDEMVDAPHTGVDVRVDDLAKWPAPMGAARPSEVGAGNIQ
ncbi:MAG: NlpC/P60 family protein [Acidimicrobiales bacterium]